MSKITLLLWKILAQILRSRKVFEVFHVWHNLYLILQALSPYHSAFSRTVEKRDREGLKLIGGCLESIWKVFGGCLVS